MQQTSRSKVAMLPFLLFIVVPILAFMFLRKYGFIFFALFLNPIFTVIGQMFTSYTIEGNQFVIQGIFKKETIAIDSIQHITTKEPNLLYQLISGTPSKYQVVAYDGYQQKPIYPSKELKFNPGLNQLFFTT